MDHTAYEKVKALAGDPSEQEATIGYLAEHLGRFLRPRENVFICFQNQEKGGLGWLMEQAVLRCNGVPHVWGEDRRWKAMLRMAFITKSTTIIGAPLLVLGLIKLKKTYETPLYVRKVITAGYPSMQWMIDGIVKGFDCEMGGCYALGTTGAVAGFACGHSWGVHLREDTYGVDIVDTNGQLLPEGEMGEIVLYHKKHPEIRVPTGENGRLVREACECGSKAPRIMDFTPGRTEEDKMLMVLGQELQSWTSILDCALRKSECGLEVRLLVIPGEELPRLPHAAKMTIENFNPEVDEPYPYDPAAGIPAR